MRTSSFTNLIFDFTRSLMMHKYDINFIGLCHGAYLFQPSSYWFARKLVLLNLLHGIYREATGVTIVHTDLLHGVDREAEAVTIPHNYLLHGVDREAEAVTIPHNYLLHGVEWEAKADLQSILTYFISHTGNRGLSDYVSWY